MSYHSITIKNTIKGIEHNKMYLPAIQRKFVWPRWKIEHLFDSIMRNYPIGSFLFWELNSHKANEYVFYDFLKNYDERSPNNTRKTGTFLHPEITGVLDGQQRLSSLYLGLQGSHRERLKYHRTTSDHAYPKTYLYLNLLSLPFFSTKNGDLEVEREKDFEFRFLTTSDAEITERRNENNELEACLWYKVGNVLRWKEDPEIDEIYDSLILLSKEEQKEAILKNRREIKKTLRTLHQRICNDQLINYFKVTKDDLDDILKIFI